MASDPPSAFILHPSSFITHPCSIPPIVIDPTPIRYSPVGSFVFSHIAAAVILGIGLLIGLAWRISLPSPEKQDSIATNPQAVGRITALADCQWSKQASGGREQRFLRPKTVYLGDRFAISSGLMQITYDTEAKVILEGPCTYEIDSDRGGYLAVGKLTARVEAGDGGRKHEISLSPLPSAPSALPPPSSPTSAPSSAWKWRSRARLARTYFRARWN